MSNKLMIFGNDMAEKGHVWKESGSMTQGRREVEVGTLLESRDEKNVIAENVLSNSFKFEV